MYLPIGSIGKNSKSYSPRVSARVDRFCYWSYWKSVVGGLAHGRSRRVVGRYLQLKFELR